MNKFIHSYEFPPEPNPIPDPNGQSLYPCSEQTGAKTLPFGAAHTYIYGLYKGATSPPGSKGVP